MKQFRYTKLIVAMLAFSFFCCACTNDKDTDSTRSKKSSREEISSTLGKEDTDLKNDIIDDTTSDTQTWVSTPSDQADDTTVADPTDDILNLSTPQAPETDHSTLGTGNISNGGFATGDAENVYYVTFPTEDKITIVKEDRATGTKTPVYTTAPKTSPVVDSLNIVGDTLYFRENQSEKESFIIVKKDLKTEDFEVIDEGEIDSFSVYNGHLYYSDACDLVRSDLDGQNKTVLYDSEGSAVPAKIAYTFVGDQIFFATPAEYDKDGYFFGKLCSMDLDGKGLKEIPVDVDICNSEFFMYDGESLFFYGTTEKDGMCTYSCKLDGSDLTSGDPGLPRSMNFYGGKYIIANDQEIFLKKDSSGYELFDSGHIRWAKIVLIGNDLYYIDYDEAKTDTLPVMTRVSLLGGGSEKLG